MPSQSAVATSSSHYKSAAVHHHRPKNSPAASKAKSSLSKQTCIHPVKGSEVEQHSSTSTDAVASAPRPCAMCTHADPTEAVVSLHAGDDVPSSNLNSRSRAGATGLTCKKSKPSSFLLAESLDQPGQSTNASSHRNARHRKPAAAADNVDMTAIVHAKGHKCTLTYSPVKDFLRITRICSSGKTRTVLNIPVHMIINIETAAEKEERQRVRQAKDEAVKLVFAESSASAGLLGVFPSGTSGDESDSLVSAHSRVNTDVSIAGGHHSGGLFFHRYSQTSLSGLSNQATSPLATAPTQLRYNIHYMRQRNSERPSIHTLEFLSHGSAEHLQATVNAVVQRVYHKGPKHIIVFISPKSGKGKSERVFDKQVRPLLHFSRHTYETYITQRAHDCEDYVADLSHPMSASTVVAAVGGDGMINEVVNGVHRRKLAFVRWLRSVTVDVVPRNSAEDNSQRLGDEGSSSSCGVDPQALATVSDSTSITTASMKAPTMPDPQGARLADSITTTATSAGVPNIHREVEENKRKPRAPAAHATAVEAQQLARRLVEEGWDALMPLVATVPTGSACGLAKSLDVLSVAESAMALVHQVTVHMDLLHMSFMPNKDLIDHQRSKFSVKEMTSAKQNFAKYWQDHSEELQKGAHTQSAVCRQQQLQGGNPRSASAVSASDPTPPFLLDGSSVYRDEVSHALKMPYFDNRVAFMSLSFGAANDIDHGSEPLRWMGNARFHVYGGYLILLGLQRYSGVLRYLPWQSKAGKTVEKLHTRHTMPSAEDFPTCTMRDDCPHCKEYTFTHCGQSSFFSSTWTAEKHTGHMSLTSHEGPRTVPGSSAAATLAPYTDAELLDEDTVDFSDSSLPWVTIRGEFCIVLMCNVRDVAQDMLMAPLAHMSDGAIDVVYCRIDPCTGRGGRMEMVKFFMGLEAGKHVELDFVNYVKARALEIKIDSGISMSDGELMPLSAARVTKLRSSVQFVRNE